MEYTSCQNSAQQSFRSIQTRIRLSLFFTVLLLVIFAAHSASHATATITVSYADKVNEPVRFEIDNTTAMSLADFDDGYVEWNFGDGFKAKIVRATHVYRTAGTYTVSFNGKLAGGSTVSATTTVTISDIPASTGSNILTVVTNGSGNGTTTFNTIQSAVNKAATLNGSAPVEIILPAGTTFDESIQLTVPTGNNYITLKSSQADNLPVGKRVDRSDEADVATILAPNGGSAVRALPNPDNQSSAPSHHYRFQGVQFKTKPNVGIVYWIVEMGRNDTYINAESKSPHHIIIDRCLFYSEDVTSEGLNSTRFGIFFDATKSSIVDSHFSNINEQAHESKAIAVDNTAGVLGFINNYLEAGSIEILFGGSVPNIPNSVTRDVEFRRNRCHKPIEKKNLTGVQKWPAKNNFEIKSGQYFVIEGNLFDTVWKGSDQRWLVNLRVINDSGSFSILKDIQFTNNKLKQGPNGIFIVAKDTTTADDAAARILIKNNSIEDISQSYGLSDGQIYGQDFTLSNGVAENLVIRHNTLFNSYALLGVGPPETTLRRPIIFNDNIGPHNQAGVWGDSKGSGNQAIDYYFPGRTFLKNVIVGATASNYPSNNFYPTDLSAQFVDLAGGDYHLSSTSPGKGAASENDGSDVGADIDTLDNETRGTISGDWSTTGGELEDVIWVNNGGGATASGNTLTKTSGTLGWNAGATSSQILSGDGYVEFTTDSTMTSKMCGFNSLHIGHNYTEIDYALSLGAGGNVRIYEESLPILKPNTNTYIFGTYAVGDIFRVEIGDGKVTYTQNGNLLLEHTITTANEYVVDSSLYTIGAQITDAKIFAGPRSVTWVNNGGGATASGNTLTKTSGTLGWNAGATSSQILSGDGYVEFTTDSTMTSKMCGFNSLHVGHNYTEIDYALSLGAGGNVRIYEESLPILKPNTNTYIFGTYAVGDVLRVEIVTVGGNKMIRYTQNGNLLLEHTITAANEYVVDSSLYTIGAQITDAQISGSWSN